MGAADLFWGAVVKQSVRDCNADNSTIWLGALPAVCRMVFLVWFLAQGHLSV